MNDSPFDTKDVDIAARKARFAAAHREPVLSCATLQGWHLEPDFLELYRRVHSNTLVDHMRCYELWSLVAETAKVDGDILEVGVWRGGTGCVMAARAQMIGRKGDVFLCDTFRGVVKAGTSDATYKGGEHANTNIGIVNQLLMENNVHNCIILQGIFPEETGDTIASRRFSLCHIDVDVYESARDIFDWVWPRMPIGGVVVFDDYGFKNCIGIAMLGEDLRARQDLVFIHNNNGHAILMKTKA
jgi:O-methyltransferase